MNQLTVYAGKSLSHDAKGNVTAFGSDSYGYSSENLLTSATVGGTSTTFAYDPLLRLYQGVSGAATSRLAYDGLDRIAEYDGSNALLRRFVFGPGMDAPIVWYEGATITSTGRRFLSSDERGSIVSVTDSAGTLVGLNKYDEYGVPASGFTGRFGYTGQAWMSAIGAWYYKARIYAPGIGGRFLQVDWVGYKDSPNLYAYVLNDPVNNTDPLGLATTPPKLPDDQSQSIVITGQRVGASIVVTAQYPVNVAQWAIGYAGNTIKYAGGATVGAAMGKTPPPPPKPAPPKPPKYDNKTLDTSNRASERWIAEQAERMYERDTHWLEMGWEILEHLVKMTGGH